MRTQFVRSAEKVEGISGPSVQGLCKYNVRVGKPDLLRTSVAWEDTCISRFLFRLLLRTFLLHLFPLNHLSLSIACKENLCYIFIRFLVLKSTRYFVVKRAPTILCIESWWSTFNLQSGACLTRNTIVGGNMDLFVSSLEWMTGI